MGSRGGRRNATLATTVRGIDQPCPPLPGPLWVTLHPRIGLDPFLARVRCRKLSETAPARVAAPMFVPVRVTQEADAPSIEIVLPEGARVRVREGDSVEWVRRVVAALRSAC